MNNLKQIPHALFLLAVGALWTSRATAQSASAPPGPLSPLPTVTVYIEGDRGEPANRLRAKIEQLFADNFTLASPKELIAALAAARARASHGGLLAQGSDHAWLAQQLQLAARSLGVAIVIYGRSNHETEKLWLLAVSGANGEILADRHVSLRPASAKGHRTSSRLEPSTEDLREALSPCFAQSGGAQAPAAQSSDPYVSIPGPESESTPTVADERAPRVQPAGARSPDSDALVAGVGYALGGRSLSFSGGAVGSLRPVRGGLTVSLLSAQAEMFLAALSPNSAIADSACYADFQRSVGLQAAPHESRTSPIGAVWQDYGLGLRYRLVGHWATLVAGVGYSESSFLFQSSASSPLSAEVVNVDYKVVRFAAELRASLQAFSLRLGGAYDCVLDTGPFGRLFPHSTSYGLEAHASAIYALPGPVRADILLGGFYARFGHTLVPNSAVQVTATGAVDQYFGLRAALAVGF